MIVSQKDSIPVTLVGAGGTRKDLDLTPEQYQKVLAYQREMRAVLNKANDAWRAHNNASGEDLEVQKALLSLCPVTVVTVYSR
jgi:hypothetical protein